MYSDDDEAVEDAWMRAESRCECERVTHAHQGRCGKPLVWEYRGEATSVGGWQAWRTGDKKIFGREAVSACEILCWACYRAVWDAALTDGQRAA